jgi:hypothetical protein
LHTQVRHNHYKTKQGMVGRKSGEWNQNIFSNLIGLTNLKFPKSVIYWY